MLQAMPVRAISIILAGDFKGADLVTLQSEIHRPSFKVLVESFMIIFPKSKISWDPSFPPKVLI